MPRAGAPATGLREFETGQGNDAAINFALPGDLLDHAHRRFDPLRIARRILAALATHTCNQHAPPGRNFASHSFLQHG
jgi:hypothetical protein